MKTLQQAKSDRYRKNRLWIRQRWKDAKSYQAEMKELMLGFAVTNDGRTFYERVQEEGHLLSSDSHRALPEA